ncbi:MAG: cupredoxin domain-containing protein [Acidimicrobiales bacterium]
MRLAVTTTALALVAVATLAAVAGSDPAAAPESGRPAAVRTITLTARHSRFTPGRVTVPVGTTVRFIIRNLDPIDHEFIVGDAATHRRHEVGRETHHHGDEAGEISVPAGTSAVTAYRITSAGPVVFGCHLPGHFAYGMRGVVVGS